MRAIFAILISCFCLAGYGQTIVTIAQFPNNPSPAGTDLLIDARTGVTNYNISFDQLMKFIGTNAVVGAYLATNPVVVTNLAENNTFVSLIATNPIFLTNLWNNSTFTSNIIFSTYPEKYNQLISGTIRTNHIYDDVWSRSVFSCASGISMVFAPDTTNNILPVWGKIHSGGWTTYYMTNSPISFTSTNNIVFLSPMPITVTNGFISCSLFGNTVALCYKELPLQH